MKGNNLSFKSQNLVVDYFEFKFDVLSEQTKQKIVQSFFKLAFNSFDVDKKYRDPIQTRIQTSQERQVADFFKQSEETIHSKMDQGSASMGEVVHLYNFENIRNRNEIPLLMQAVLNGAEYAGYTDGILFLNYE